VVDDGVPGIGTALVANDDIGVTGKHVSDFALAFVAPVAAYNRFDHDTVLLGDLTKNTKKRPK